ncbi:MAG: chromate resistance protein ChrB domain-containing protein [Planctomycetota bacterium]
MKWATRTNMKTDRVACAWLIKSRIDPEAEFFFFPAETLIEEARKIDARTFDARDADYGHVGMKCSFETMMDRHELSGKDPALDHMAEIINASDIRVKLYDFQVMEGFGIWTLAQGFAAAYPDDQDKLAYAVPAYEALYQWCRIKMSTMKLTHFSARSRPEPGA